MKIHIGIISAKKLKSKVRKPLPPPSFKHRALEYNRNNKHKKSLTDNRE